jgi:riboflavin synthase
VEKDSFSVSIIPHTASETTLSLLKVGDTINLEVDMVGKYVENFLMNPGEPLAVPGSNNTNKAAPAKSAITAEFLIQNGF